jgi:hypothetical protein
MANPKVRTSPLARSYEKRQLRPPSPAWAGSVTLLLAPVEPDRTGIPHRCASRILIAVWRWSGCPHPAPPAGLARAWQHTEQSHHPYPVTGAEVLARHRGHLALGMAPKACSIRSNYFPELDPVTESNRTPSPYHEETHEAGDSSSSRPVKRSEVSGLNEDMR